MAKTASPPQADDETPTIFEAVKRTRGLKAPAQAIDAKRVAEIADQSGFPDRPAVYGNAAEPTPAGQGGRTTPPEARRPTRRSERSLQRNIRISPRVSALVDRLAADEDTQYSVIFERAVLAYARAKGVEV